MSDDLNEQKTETGPVDATEADALGASRRRLFKRGIAAAPVVLTLVSQPVLAWHCKTPSAWGSEYINPNTSLKTNGAHSQLPDEAVWTVTNWMSSNSTRAGLRLPWVVLAEKYPDKNISYETAKVRKVCNAASIQRPTGFSADALVKDVLGNNVDSCLLVAQLNVKLLGGNIAKCVSLDELKLMAKRQFPETGGFWDDAKIYAYLTKNYLAAFSG